MMTETVDQQQHSDDLAVDLFAAAMKLKLAEARAAGRGGWDDPARCSIADLCRDLRVHTHKGDPVDVANYAMMIWARGSGILRAQPAKLSYPVTAQQLNQAIDVQQELEAERTAAAACETHGDRRVIFTPGRRRADREPST